MLPETDTPACDANARRSTGAGHIHGPPPFTLAYGRSLGLPSELGWPTSMGERESSPESSFVLGHELVVDGGMTQL